MISHNSQATICQERPRKAKEISEFAEASARQANKQPALRLAHPAGEESEPRILKLKPFARAAALPPLSQALHSHKPKSKDKATFVN